MEGLRFHDLRHSCASLLRASAADAKLIQEHLRHANVGTTLSVYAHLFRDDKSNPVAALDGLLIPVERQERDWLVSATPIVGRIDHLCL
jgi:integrase